MTDRVEQDTDLEQHIKALPVWSGEPALRPLVGGLCNTSYVATDGTGSYVVRIGNDILVHNILQASVQTAMRAASEIGVTPEIRYSEPSLTVLDFVSGGALGPEDVTSAETLAKIVPCLQKLHAGTEHVRGPLTYFWPFQIVRQYVSTGLEKDSRLKDKLPELRRVADFLESKVRPFTPVLTHNDIVPQNLMFDDRKDVWLIDWDYGGFGHPMFDIAAVGANADADEETEQEILRLYYGRVDHELWKEYVTFKIIINLREYMWGMVQEVSSELDQAAVMASMAEHYPDQEQGYEGYTNLNAQRFEEAWARYQPILD